MKGGKAKIQPFFDFDKFLLTEVWGVIVKTLLADQPLQRIEVRASF
jgi:hypothetical protein